jgi:hypothetical protein
MPLPTTGTTTAPQERGGCGMSAQQEKEEREREQARVNLMHAFDSPLGKHTCTPACQRIEEAAE